MNIISLNFSIFLIFSLILYYFIKKYQVFLLILLSLIFYSYSGLSNSFLLFIFISLDYFAIKKLVVSKKNSKSLFYMLILLNLFPLLITKYSSFFKFYISIPQLLGISFITFIVIGNLIDIFRLKKLNFSFSQFILANIFFPQITSGPISRGKDILPQIRNEKRISYDNFYKGFQLIFFGFFQKLVLANRLGLYVDAIYEKPNNFVGFPLLIALYFFTFQIYFDFLSYTNIARGIAKLFGYDLTINFNYPYFSKSFTEFWRRWHISLSNWLRDYIYISLGGSRVPITLIFINIVITFLISGLWHGAGWNFILWGLINGIFVFLDRLLNLSGKIQYLINLKIIKYLRIFITFNLITLLWVLFKTQNLSQSLGIYKDIFLWKNYHSGFTKIVSEANLFENFEVGIFVLFPYVMYEVISYLKFNYIFEFFDKAIIKYAIYVFLIFAILFFGIFGKQNFYYVKF